MPPSILAPPLPPHVRRVPLRRAGVANRPKVVGRRRRLAKVDALACAPPHPGAGAVSAGRWRRRRARPWPLGGGMASAPPPQKIRKEAPPKIRKEVRLRQPRGAHLRSAAAAGQTFGIWQGRGGAGRRMGGAALPLVHPTPKQTPRPVATHMDERGWWMVDSTAGGVGWWGWWWCVWGGGGHVHFRGAGPLPARDQQPAGPATSGTSRSPRRGRA